MSWEDKVQRVIGRLSYASWYEANHDASGHRYKRHRPYSIPQEARDLVEILGMKNRREAEHRAKEAMMLYRQQGLPID